MTVTGVVQGVGFRPFVHRIASELGLSGVVGNDARSVFIEAQGSPRALDEFCLRLRTDAPPLAWIVDVNTEPADLRDDDGFAIVTSQATEGVRTLVAPDVAPCERCLAELFDAGNRRFRHPFITCTDCGPRFTIIQDLPYDRPATTMAAFAMCSECATEYSDPADRRFHAQPIACRRCGPVLRFERDGASVSGTDASLAEAHRALRAGSIVAVKGIGGFHLACRADDPAALGRLRERKARDQKPFALLVRDLSLAHQLAIIDGDEERVLAGPARPIVLVRARSGAPVADGVAPGNPLLGLMLPSSPLHHLLLSAVPGGEIEPPAVLVLTSANISDEPLCFDDADARERLPRLADAVLTHDRGIHVPCDDSVVRVVDGHELPIRRSRGYAPLPIRLPRELAATLAVGGELKNTCCLIDGAYAFCSAHIGDMGSVQTTRAFERAVDQLTTLHQASPDVVAADAHPAYLTRVWAERHAGADGEAALEFVQHHHAHIVSLLAESGRIGEPVIGVAFDGTGYGDDASIWGGEILLLGSDSSRYERAGHLRPVDLPGGDAAVRNPCRMALAYLRSAGVEWTSDLPPVAACDSRELAAVEGQLAAGVGTVRCTSMGRLFDTVASLLGIRHRIGYEAQAAIELEILAESGRDCLDDLPALPVRADGEIDHRPLIRDLVAGLRAGSAPAALAFGFHIALARAVADSAERLAGRTGVRTVGLSGGVFQNVLLLRACRAQLAERGLTVLTHRLVPPNDGGLALGQAVVAALRNTPDHRAVALEGPAEGDRHGC